MGQYHQLINYTKKEVVNPHKLGDGLKLWEWSDFGMLRAIQALLAVSNGRGGGDLTDDTEVPPMGINKLVGRWAGDKIAIVGDYAEVGDLPWAKKSSPNFMWLPNGKLKKGWTDISEAMAVYLQACCGYSFESKDGWRQRIEDESGKPMKPRMSIDMLIGPKGIESNKRV